MNFLKKIFTKQKILLRCNYCACEVYFSKKLVEQLENKNKDDPVCPPKTECHYCHMGFVIPVSYKSKNGKIYKFDDLSGKIPLLDPHSFFERLLDKKHF
jgi:hypothetical protein